jgi:hypothetical protein
MSQQVIALRKNFTCQKKYFQAHRKLLEKTQEQKLATSLCKKIRELNHCQVSSAFHI